MRLRELSIIQYQNVSRRSHLGRLWLSLDSFRRQLDHLSSHPFECLSMDDAVDYMNRTQKIKGRRPISLTFDNGYLDFYEDACPLLSSHGFPATVLISPPRVGTHIDFGNQSVDYLTWGHLGELTRHGIAIGAYMDDSWNINNIPEKVVVSHVLDYKKQLEDKLGIEIRYLGVKEGVPNPGIRELLIKTGYRAFLTECPTNCKADLYAIGRIQVDDDDFNIFLTKISRSYLFFKDRGSWKYIREYSLDKLAHRLSEAYDRMRGVKTH